VCSFVTKQYGRGNTVISIWLSIKYVHKVGQFHVAPVAVTLDTKANYCHRLTAELVITSSKTKPERS